MIIYGRGYLKNGNWKKCRLKNGIHVLWLPFPVMGGKHGIVLPASFLFTSINTVNDNFT
jgi:hypothetical protein